MVRPIRLMVVDDEAIIRMDEAEMLSSVGYNVVATAGSGEEAIAKAKEHRPELILMDIIMPGDKNGIQASQEISDTLNIPVIFVTAFADENLVARAKKSCPYGYIIKPFQGPEIKAAIEVALYKKEMEDKLRDSEEKYRTVVEQSRDGIGIIQDGVFRFLNNSLREMVCWEKTDIPPAFEEYFVQDDKKPLIEAASRWLRGMADTDVCEFRIRSDTEIIHVEVNAVKIEYRGKPAVLAFFRDITQRKDAQRILESLINKINCDNQLIITILERTISESYTDSGLTERLGTALEYLFGNASSVKKACMLQEIKSGRQKPGSHSPIESLGRVLERIRTEFQSRSIEINTHYQGNAPNIMADDFLDDLLFILIENSIRHTKSVAVLDVSVGEICENNRDFVQIVFEDNSQGIDDAEKASLFSTAGDGYNLAGPGLGLAVVHAAIRRYGGRIDLQDRVRGDSSKGCRVSLMLPVSGK